jgi:hypothetical protein
MRLITSAILIIVSMSLLSLQFSGLHQHVNIQGSNGESHGTHMHDLDHDGNDHDKEVDVSFFELGVTWSKIMPFLLTLVLVLLVIGRAAQSISFPPCRLLQSHKRSRWRPPLRAPPFPA